MKPFRFVFTDANPGFWAMNIFRDYHATIAHLPGAWSPVGTYTVEWVKGVREGFKSVFGMPSDVVEDMLKGKMLISMISNRLEATEDDTILDRLLVQVQRKKLDWHALSRESERLLSGRIRLPPTPGSRSTIPRCTKRKSRTLSGRWLARLSSERGPPIPSITTSSCSAMRIKRGCGPRPRRSGAERPHGHSRRRPMCSSRD